MMPTSLRSCLALMAATTLLSALPAHAQYRVVGPDGKVTYTDRPPPATDGKAQPVARGAAGGGSDLSSLPFALRQAATRFPVTLYTASKCEPCDQGRQLLQRRGVPFSERIATTQEDRDQWEKLLGGQEAPVIKIGQQTIRGFSAAQWDETLDLAGYSRTSQLPANFKTGAAEPLVERKPVPAAAASAPATAAIPAPEDTRSTPGNIRF